MKNEEYFVNVIALSEAFLENNKSKLENVKSLVIDLVDLNNNITERTATKETLSDEMINIFKDGVTNLKEINLNYLESNGLKHYLTGISILK